MATDGDSELRKRVTESDEKPEQVFDATAHNMHL
ncbi:hypothetical protein E2C01_017223 [Portunus trituberculatus]|uniref:Uncharacterized protein n=1 Tax=Portunus trituberculatus TaxID=210409 RepID=A0A5B7DRV6_PORTR|nr:hypothetical protein [Portunus trituberculatus]